MFGNLYENYLYVFYFVKNCCHLYVNDCTNIIIKKHDNYHRFNNVHDRNDYL
jgi:hypothetical protein